MKTLREFIAESDRDFRRGEGKMLDDMKRLKKDFPKGSIVKTLTGDSGEVVGHDYPVVHVDTANGRKSIHHTKIAFDHTSWEKSGKKRVQKHLLIRDKK